jgi:hypothetical protein
MASPIGDALDTLIAIAQSTSQHCLGKLRFHDKSTNFRGVARPNNPLKNSLGF